MKKLLIILSLFVCGKIVAQTTWEDLYLTPYYHNGIKVTNIHFQKRTTLATNSDDSSSAFIYNLNDTAVYLFFNGNNYRLNNTFLSNGGGGIGLPNSNAGAGYRLAVVNTNAIKTLFPGLWQIMDSSTNANGLTLKTDTAAAAAYFPRRKDSNVAFVTPYQSQQNRTLNFSFGGDVVGTATGTNTFNISLGLVGSGAVAGTYTSPTITVNSKGLITSITNGTGGGGTGGSGSSLANFYLKDSAISNDRTLDLNTHNLNFKNGSTYSSLFNINSNGTGNASGFMGDGNTDQSGTAIVWNDATRVISLNSATLTASSLSDGSGVNRMVTSNNGVLGFASIPGGAAAADTATLNVHTNGYNDLRYQPLENQRLSTTNNVTFGTVTGTSYKIGSTLVLGQSGGNIYYQAPSGSHIWNNAAGSAQNLILSDAGVLTTRSNIVAGGSVSAGSDVYANAATAPSLFFGSTPSLNLSRRGTGIASLGNGTRDDATGTLQLATVGLGWQNQSSVTPPAAGFTKEIADSLGRITHITSNNFIKTVYSPYPGNQVWRSPYKANGGTYADSADVFTALAGKQATLVSGTNIKTINGNSLLGSGNLPLSGGGGIDSVRRKSIASDSIIQYSGGTGTFAFRTRREVHVKDFSPYGGDSIHDETTYFQAAVNYADSVDAVLIIDKPKVYWNIAGAIDATCDCQVKVPAHIDTARKVFVMKGDAQISTLPVGGALFSHATTKTISGAKIKSTVSVGTDAGSHVFGTAASATTLIANNFGIEVHAPAIIGGISWKNGGNCDIEHITFYSDTNIYDSPTPVIDVSGIETPDGGRFENYRVANNTVIGIRTGILFGEHSHVVDNTVYGCYNSYATKSGGHLADGIGNLSQWSVNDFYVGAGNPLTVNWQDFAVEAATASVVGNKWYVNKYQLNDSLNGLKGIFWYRVDTTSQVGDYHGFAKKGGVKVATYELSDSIFFAKLKAPNNYFSANDGATISPTSLTVDGGNTWSGYIGKGHIAKGGLFFNRFGNDEISIYDSAAGKTRALFKTNGDIVFGADAINFPILSLNNSSGLTTFNYGLNLSSTPPSNTETAPKVLIRNASSGTAGNIEQASVNTLLAGGNTATQNYLPKFSGALVLQNSRVIDDGTNIGVNVSSPTALFDIKSVGTSGDASLRLTSTGTGGSNGYAYLQFANTGGNKFTFSLGGANETSLGVANKLYLYNVAASGVSLVVDGSGNLGLGNTSPSYKLDVSGTQRTTGAVRFSNYGAGTATFDASGNITSSSDIRLKTSIHYYYSGLKQLMNIKPISYQWNKLSGNEMQHEYAGFSAQNVKANIPLSTGVDDRGYLSLQDRAIMATLVNSVKELKQLIDKQQNQITDLKKEVKKLKSTK